MISTGFFTEKPWSSSNKGVRSLGPAGVLRCGKNWCANTAGEDGENVLQQSVRCPGPLQSHQGQSHDMAAPTPACEACECAVHLQAAQL
jgi:hypothetical protein